MIPVYAGLTARQAGTERKKMNSINTSTYSSGANLLMNYSAALANAKQELAYWSARTDPAMTIDDITKKEIEKWASEIQKYEKLIEEFLQKTPIGHEDWFREFTGWIAKAFDIFWYIFKKIKN